MPRKSSENGQHSQSDLTHQAEPIEGAAQEFSAELDSSTATTSPDELMEEVAETIVTELLTFRQRLWGLVAKKLRSQLSPMTNYPDSMQLSPLPSQDGLLPDISSSAEPLPILPQDASS